MQKVPTHGGGRNNTRTAEDTIAWDSSPSAATRLFIESGGALPSLISKSLESISSTCPQNGAHVSASKDFPWIPTKSCSTNLAVLVDELCGAAKGSSKEKRADNDTRVLHLVAMAPTSRDLKRFAFLFKKKFFVVFFIFFVAMKKNEKRT